jgi:nitrate/nitrite transporter NarK
MASYHGLEKKQGLLCTAAFIIISCLTRSATGGLTDKYGGGTCACLMSFTTVLGTIILSFSQPNDPYTFWTIGGLVIISMSFGLLNGATFKWIVSLTPK